MLKKKLTTIMDIYLFLISKDKAYNPETNKINQDKAIYPSYTKSIYLSKKQKDKKRETFRNKYIIIDNDLYKKDKDQEKNNVKYIIPLEAECFNLVKKMHLDNGHLGANRTCDKITEQEGKYDK